MSPMQATLDRCSVHVIREGEQFFKVTCSCGAVPRAYSSRHAATQAAVRHGTESGHGFSVTNR